MTDTATSATTQGAHHIGLTVPNLDETRNFFLDTLGYEQGVKINEPRVILILKRQQSKMQPLTRFRRPGARKTSIN